MKEKYKNIPVEYLIIFGIYSLTYKGEDCNFEQLVEECFTLFPKVFGFSQYPHWPDSLKFDRPLRKLREKSWLAGNLPQLDEFRNFLEEFGSYCLTEEANKLYKELAIA